MYTSFLENILRKFCKCVYFKIFACYSIRHYKQTTLTNIVSENSNCIFSETYVCAKIIEWSEESVSLELTIDHQFYSFTIFYRRTTQQNSRLLFLIITVFNLYVVMSDILT